MKASRHFDLHGNNYCHAALFCKSMVILILLLFPDIVTCQEKIPRWFYELPASEDVQYAIGECDKSVNHELQSLEAREVAAFRLAETVCTFIRFGVAEDVTDAAVRQVSFASISIDTTMMEKFLISMTVLDSCQLPSSFHLVVSSSESGHLPDYYRESITTRNSIPKWVKSPPKEEGYIYGIGSSWKSGILGYELAERMARVDIAIQRDINLQIGTWKLLEDTRSFNQIISKQESQIQLLNTQVIGRAMDDLGAKYVLVRKKR